MVTRDYQLWSKALRKIRPLERRMASKLQKAFLEQRKEVLKNVEKHRIRLERLLARHRKKMVEQKASSEITVVIDDIKFDGDVWEKEFRKRFWSDISAAVTLGGRDALLGIDLDFVFSVSDPNVAKYIKHQVYTFAADVNASTLRRITPKLRKVILAGGSLEDVRQAVQELFPGTTRQLPYRARLIAQTEMIGGANGGRMQAYLQSDKVKGKRWLTSHDKRVRDTHKAAGREGVVPVKNLFKATKMLYPGDPDGTVSERCNCRCVLTGATRIRKR